MQQAKAADMLALARAKKEFDVKMHRLVVWVRWRKALWRLNEIKRVRESRRQAQLHAIQSIRPSKLLHDWTPRHSNALVHDPEPTGALPRVHLPSIVPELCEWLEEHTRREVGPVSLSRLVGSTLCGVSHGLWTERVAPAAWKRSSAVYPSPTTFWKLIVIVSRDSDPTQDPKV
jgi:hypothetical protein